ncbi:cell division protein FtsW [Propionibacterium australiense]|uniref:Probable peptidoglycan glycosyltransferase FtsW n=1 Tax=Propionibacterium australiense TaxID=119981 RepID=A0A8B3FTR8_9ACTN|nr:cell division protein FtsW [Propionibacterium australiense]RLP12674.1 cell division protein FtsW [Propionibacterium australiense]
MREALSRPAADYYLVLSCTGLLVGLGVLMVLSSSSVYAAENLGNAYYFFVRHMTYLAFGVPLGWWISRRSEQTLGMIGVLLVIGMIVAELLVVFTPLGDAASGASNKGNRNWLYLGSFSLQPSEFAKLGLILWAAGVFAAKYKKLTRPSTLLFPVALGFVVIIGLVVIGGHDLGTGVILLAIMLAVFWFIGTPWYLLAAVVTAAALLVAGMVVTSPGRVQRIRALVSGSDTVGTSEQPLNAVYALATGGWWGVGLGRSRAKWGGLYDGALNDYVFAVLGEELGLFGTIVVIGLFLGLGLIGLRIAARSTRVFWRVVAASVTAWLLIQAMLNIAVAMRMIPVMGVPLPFISYGGSSLIATLMAVGALLAAARHEPEAMAALKRRSAPARERTVRVTSVVDGKGR